ncbi:MAG: hypothetical protein NUV69_00905 [Candidatus Curtissbacteria bacterium]|nr:hypothetical protein [Candidatus Curtissbacteria bacterium]
MNKTIIYYTSNHEDPAFEQKIIDCLLENCGDVPIVSVSQKPMKLGKNICVGEVGQSYVNEWRQIIIGAKTATTKYLIMAESDFLYSPEYFQFEPKGENIYRCDNIWIMWLDNDKKYKRYNFHRKHYSEGAQIVRRKYFIDLLEKYLEQFPTWYNKSYKELKSHISPYYNEPYTFFHGENPCISIKTKNGITFITGIKRGAENISKNLPYWGNVKDLRSKFL